MATVEPDRQQVLGKLRAGAKGGKHDRAGGLGHPGLSEALATWCGDGQTTAWPQVGAVTGFR